VGRNPLRAQRFVQFGRKGVAATGDPEADLPATAQPKGPGVLRAGILRWSHGADQKCPAI
jgi:hypothetical protein